MTDPGADIGSARPRPPAPRRAPLWLSAQHWIASLLAVGIVVLVGQSIRWDFVNQLDFSALWVYRWALLEGLGNTLLLTGGAVTLGLAIGFVLAAGMQLPGWPVRFVIGTYVEVLRNTPLVLQLFWVHYALPYFTGHSTTAFQSGLIVMTVQSSAYLADVARAGIQAVPRGQWEAAEALGLPFASRWGEVILPQAIRIIIPPLANIAIGYFKASAVLALLAVGELMTVAVRVSNHAFKPIETLTVVGLVYLALGYAFSGLTFRLERVFGKSDLRA
jgi:polar amino acid transport system permease protein